MRVLLAAAILALTGCASTAAPRSAQLIGVWQGASDNAVGTSLELRSDGTALWNLKETFAISYRTDLGPTPHHLDLFGFQTGPLANRTLYCIFELPDRDTLRLDCEPSQEKRPLSFNPSQTQTFARQRSRQR